MAEKGIWLDPAKGVVTLSFACCSKVLNPGGACSGNFAAHFLPARGFLAVYYLYGIVLTPIGVQVFLIGQNFETEQWF